MPELSPQKNGSEAENSNPLTTAVNIITAPIQAFSTIRLHPTSLVPLSAVLLSVMLVTGWYFAILDFDWYIDDTLNRIPDLQGAELEEAREGMAALSKRGMLLIGVLGSALGLLAIYLLQTAYLSLVAALRGDELRFRQWFSLVCWTNLPALFASMSMAVTILLNPSGQLSNYDLNALSLYNLGMQTDNQSLNQVFSALSLVQFWSLALLASGYRHWTGTTVIRASTTVLAPYLLIFGIWTYFALT